MQLLSAGFAGPAYGAIAGAAFTLLLGAVCVSDLRTRRIPNTLVLVIAVLGIVYSVVSNPWLPGIGRAFGGLAVGLVLWFPFFLFGMLGAGDVKFFAAASAWIGATAALEAALLSALFGGVLAIGSLVVTHGWRGAALTAATARHGQIPGDSPTARSGKKLPYGLAMAAGLAVAAWFPNIFSR